MTLNGPILWPYDNSSRRVVGQGYIKLCFAWWLNTTGRLFRDLKDCRIWHSAFHDLEQLMMPIGK